MADAKTPSDDDYQRWGIENALIQTIRARTGIDLESTCRRRLGESTLVTISVPELLSIISMDIIRSSG